MIKRILKLMRSFFIKKKDGLLMSSGYYDTKTGKFAYQYEIYQLNGKQVRSPLVTKPEDFL
jgi:hypothetical protein